MYTIKSISSDGTYYLVKNWRQNRELWVNKSKMDSNPQYWFTSEAKARQSLKSLLGVMDEYLTDDFYVVDDSGNETVLDVKELGFDHIPDYEDDIDACNKVEGAVNPDFADEKIKFFYNGEFLGSCDPDYMDCRRLYDVMQSDKVLSDLILEYLNSFGDPIYPISDEEWGDPETDSSKLDIWDLYNTFMDWISHEYREYPEDFYVDLSTPRSGKHTLEIFDDPVAEENVVSSTKIKASRYEGVPGYNPPKGGYLYIFKHGIGPGTLPSDVEIIKTKDLPNYYTAVWLSDFLTTDELKKYDIPDETRINEILGRIGYCQKDGDVVPCEDVEACGDIKSSTKPRYMADMVSASSSDSAYDENDEPYRYHVAGYYSVDSNGHPYGLAESLYTNDFDEALETAHTYCGNGDYVEFTNQITGMSLDYDPDDWNEAIEYGEFPTSVYDLL